MKSIVQSALFLFFTFFSFFQVLYSQPNPDIDKLDRYFTALEQNNRFMGSVFIMYEDEILFNRAYGIMAADGTPAVPESIYRIGSITKSYTDVMILKLVEQGELTLDSTLDQFFPSIPNSNTITVEHLLRHQSGLVNFTNLPEYIEYYLEPRNREEHLAYFEKIGTSFEPGANTEYSNTAYLLLGFIVEKLTRMDYEEALQKMIVEPIGLQSTYFGDGIDTAGGEAESFFYREGEWHLSPETHMSVPHAAGAIISTAGETAAFYKALFNGELLTDESFEKMVSFEGPFGLGMIRFPFHDNYISGHNGGIDGYQSNSAHDPDNNLTFAILGNGVNYNFNDILIGLLSIIYGMDFEFPDFKERQSIILTDEQLAAYSGTYTSPDFPLEIRLFAENGNLMGQATGQGAFPLTIYDEQTMAFEQAGIELLFEEREKERFQSFELRQSGMVYQFSLED
ncbi:serine hydrolase domain-containing protein [soil metagenome]